MRLQYIECKDGGWEFRFINKGRIILHSESYDSFANAKRAVKSFESEFLEAVTDDKLEIDIQEKFNKERADLLQ